MKAAVRFKYGNHQVIEIKDLPKPEIKVNDILVKVYATTVNRTDCGVLTGSPFVFQFFIGLFTPKRPILGTDFAGVVEDIGKNVSKFKIGDRVWGLNDEGLSSQAEYMAISDNQAIAKIPNKISFIEAAASAEGAHYAVNFIKKIEIKPGMKIMLNGATGGIGSAALQILKSKGCTVFATCQTEHIEKIKDLGADKVIDYTKEDFTKLDEKFDVIFDSVGKSSFKKCKNIMKDGGVYLSSELGDNAENLYLPILTAFSKKKVKFPIPTNPQNSIEELNSMLEKGTFRPLIDRTYNLYEAQEAYNYVSQGKKIGNVILEI